MDPVTNPIAADVGRDEREESARAALIPIRDYIVGAAIYATCYYAAERVLFPSQRTPVNALVHAVLWGIVMQVLTTRRERLTREGKDAYSPAFYALTGCIGLVMCAVYWHGETPHPQGVALFVLLGGIALSLYIISYAFTLSRRRRARGLA